MKVFAVGLIVFGLIIVYFPDILAYLLGGFFVFLGVNMLLISWVFGTKKSSSGGEEFIKFWKYKIYR